MTDVKIKCDDCKFVDDCVDYGWDGCKKFTPKQSEPMTNEEWLRSCSTEQLAGWIKGHMNCNFCPMRLKCEDMRNCMEHIKSWLKQPHTNE